MKRYLGLSLLSMVVSAIPLFAADVRYFETSGLIYDERRGIYYRIPVWLTYDPSSGSVKLSFQGFFNEYAIVFTDRNRKLFLDLLDKYLDWLKEARRRGVLVGRTFGSLDVPLYFNLKGMGWSYDPSVALKVMSLGMSGRFMLVLDISSKLYREGTGTKVEKLFLRENEARKLREALTDEFIRSKAGG